LSSSNQAKLEFWREGSERSWRFEFLAGRMGPRVNK